MRKKELLKKLKDLGYHRGFSNAPNEYKKYGDTVYFGDGLKYTMNRFWKKIGGGCYDWRLFKRGVKIQEMLDVTLDVNNPWLFDDIDYKTYEENYYE